MEGGIGGVGVDDQVVLGSELQSDPDVVVLEGDDWERLGLGHGEVEWQLDVHSDDVSACSGVVVTVQGVGDHLADGVTSENQLIDVDVRGGGELMEDFEEVSGQLVDGVVTDFECKLLQSGMSCAWCEVHVVDPWDGEFEELCLDYKIHVR